MTNSRNYYDPREPAQRAGLLRGDQVGAQPYTVHHFISPTSKTINLFWNLGFDAWSTGLLTYARFCFVDYLNNPVFFSHVRTSSGMGWVEKPSNTEPERVMVKASSVSSQPYLNTAPQGGVPGGLDLAFL